MSHAVYSSFCQEYLYMRHYLITLSETDEAFGVIFDVGQHYV